MERFSRGAERVKRSRSAATEGRKMRRREGLFSTRKQRKKGVLNSKQAASNGKRERRLVLWLKKRKLPWAAREGEHKGGK